jgi:hypothetical protein
MKIKSQYYLLLAGIIIIPLTLLSIILSQNYANNSQRLIIPGYDELVGHENSDFTIDAESWNIVQKKLSRRPADIEYLIFDKDYSLVLTNLDFFLTDEKSYGKKIAHKNFLILCIPQAIHFFIKLIQLK